jgi:parvulin-like peptidyl-prolyl isomerase
MKIAIWVSREKILPAQEKLLKDAGYNIIIYNKGIYNVEDFLDEIKDFDDKMYERVLLIPVVPESVKMRLLEKIKNRGLKFEVVEPVMKDLGRYDNEELCKALVHENADSRVMVKLKDDTCRVYEFIQFKRLVEYVKRYDEGWSL